MRKTLIAVAASLLMAPFAPTHAMAIIVQGRNLSDILDSVSVDGDNNIDVNGDQFLNGDDWQVSAAGGSVAPRSTPVARWSAGPCRCSRTAPV